jgi:hypothetical protein
MERRYLIATLAVIATFAGFSRGFQSLQQLSLQRGQHGQAISGPQCSGLPSIVSRWYARIKTELHPADPEEAQLLAELNLPLAAMQAKAAKQAAKQSQAAAEIARETAMREAERAKRDAVRMREQMARADKTMAVPVSVDLHGLDGLDQRIQVRTAALAERIAARNVRVQIAAAKLQAVSMQLESSGKRHSPCGARRAQIQ